MVSDATRRPRAHPFFVVGAQRSGSTLIRLMLDHHPEIAVPHEFDFVLEALSTPDRWPDPSEVESVFQQSGSFQRSGLRLEPTLPFPELAEDLLRQHQGKKPCVGMVVHAHFDRILRIWPDASFVHLVRDPRDVASSVIGMGWAGNVWHGTDRWVAAERSWDRLHARIPPGRFVELRFEDLLAHPRRELARVCALLGMDYHDDMLSYATDTTYRAPDATRKERWRERLSTQEIRLVESRAGAMLVGRGYEPSGLPALRVGRARRALLSADDRLGRIRMRVRRYGAALFLGDVVTRKLLPIPGLRAHLRARMQKISDRLVQ